MKQNTWTHCLFHPLLFILSTEWLFTNTLQNIFKIPSSPTEIGMGPDVMGTQKIESHEHAPASSFSLQHYMGKASYAQSTLTALALKSLNLSKLCGSDIPQRCSNVQKHKAHLAFCCKSDLIISLAFLTCFQVWSTSVGLFLEKW